jgi:glycyl-tRNA synthetase beta chain
MDSILLEIGGEEIPAGYIQPALDAMADTLTKKLGGARISHGGMKTYGTPRRLAIIVNAVAPKQTSLSAEVLGPPVRVGRDADGNLTVAGMKFAEKVGVSPNRLKVTSTEKGEYLCAKKTERGRATSTVLKTLLPEVVQSVPFPKSMRWADLADVTFARPIHSIAALYGKQVITFTVGNVKSGRFTMGHYFMDPRRIKIDHPASYVELLRGASVIADISERRAMVDASVTEAAKTAGGRLLDDPELIDIVTNLVEYPLPTAGHFEEEFLEVPQEVLITAMREHQKYFAVVDDQGNLKASFIAVNNTRTRDMDLVATGHERVLRARLSDAQFFYRSDLQIPNAGRIDKLKGVLFQAKLGSMLEKTDRICRLAEHLADHAPGAPESLKEHAVKAARLCKSDLVSQVVVEFPKLQGVMGRVYAAVDGEPGDVPTAIEEHYRPTYSGAVLPRTLTGAVVSIADKMDSICGCFSVGLVPTGAADPYALRRQAIGITQILKDKGFALSLQEAIGFGLEPFADKATQDLTDAEAQIYDFFRRRISRMLVDEGFSKDVVAAVTAIDVDRIPSTWARVAALESLKTADDFEPLAVAFKRVVNIMKKADLSDAAQVDESLFADASETDLHAAFQQISSRVQENMAAERFDQALRDIASLRASVDRFFEDVMVMAEDKTLRDNRLALLKRIAGLFDTFADFSKISA